MRQQRRHDYPDPHANKGQRPEKGRIKKTQFCAQPQPADYDKKNPETASPSPFSMPPSSPIAAIDFSVLFLLFHFLILLLM
jgi:hypothetical protein